MNNFLKFHMDDMKEDIKKKWKILDYLEEGDADIMLDDGTEDEIKIINLNDEDENETDVSKFSIRRLKKLFGAK